MFLSYGPNCCWSMSLQDSLKCNISRNKWMMKFFQQVNKHCNFLQVGIVILGVHSQICPKCTQNKLAYFCNILRKIKGMKLIFCLQINMKVFHRLIVSLWVRVPSHSQSAQNNKFAMSLQYLKENMKNEVDFLSTDKH